MLENNISDVKYILLGTPSHEMNIF